MRPRANDGGHRGFPWGLLGLVGLAGLAGLRRRDPDATTTTSYKVGDRQP